MASCKECGGSISHINSTLLKCDFCGKLYSMVNGELSEANKGQIYDSAVAKAKNQNEQLLQEATELFEALGPYKDSALKAIDCKEAIRKQKVLEEDRRLEARRQAEKEEIENKRRAEQQAKMARIKGICIFGAALCVIIIAVVVGASYLSKKSKYDKAMEQYTKGQYEKALEIFDALGGYSDSQTYADTISNLIVERDNAYNQGASYFNSGMYEECIAVLKNISDYSDASDYIEKSADALYQEATDLFDKGEYVIVKEKLSVIPAGSNSYTSAQTLLVQTEKILVEQEKETNYEKAIENFDNGDYDTAQKLFVSLVDYSDAQSYLSAIGTIYYEEAQHLYGAGSYIECSDKLECIDTAEEWTEYTVALDLKQQTAEAYHDFVENEAKSICRKEGDVAMAKYLDEAVCSILSVEEVAVLKESCHIEVISLSELEPYVTSGGGIDDASGMFNDIRTDTLGNVYEYTLYSDDRGSSNTYYLNNEYMLFTATVAVHHGLRFGAGAIRIYGDGRLLWSDESIEYDDKPYAIEVDVSGVQDLKIDMQGFRGANWSTGILLCDPMLSE